MVHDGDRDRDNAGCGHFSGRLDFRTVIEGATVAAKTIQVMNSGTHALHVSAISLSGSNPGFFAKQLLR